MGNLNSQIVSDFKARWRSGETPNAHLALESHPELLSDKSLVVDLAYEEYCQRSAEGEEVDFDDFCGRFRSFGESLRRRIEVHEFLAANPDFSDELCGEAWPDPGDTVCGFRLLEELGRGAVGRVFLAEELALAHRQVVVKLTHQGTGEAETLSRLRHPNIVPIYSIDQESLSELTIICMPFLGRSTLQDFLGAAFSEKKMPARFQAVLDVLNRPKPDHEDVPVAKRNQHCLYVDGVIDMVAALCDALAHSHKTGILHLDLKPSNILVTPSGTPLLLDFNLSLGGALHSSVIGGTLPYMSPEQIRSLVFGHHESAVDKRSDLYSLGIILHQLLTGAYPFGQLSWRTTPLVFAERLLELQKKGVAAASGACPSVSRELLAIIAKATAWSPADRYASAEAFAEALREQLKPWHRAKRFRATHRREFLVGAIAGCTSLAFGVYYQVTKKPFVEAELERAWQLFDDEQNEAALASFNRVINHDSQVPDAWFGRGRCHQRLGDFISATDAFKQANNIQSDPRYVACWGFCDSLLPRYASAVERYETAIDMGFESPSLYNCLGVAYANTSSPKAEEALRKAVDGESNSPIVLHNLAAFAESKQRWEDAWKYATAAISLPDASPFTSLTAAMAAWQSKRTNSDRERDAKAAITRGAELGLRRQDLSGPFVSTVLADATVAAALDRNTAEPKPLLILTDPLDDPAITQAACLYGRDRKNLSR